MFPPLRRVADEATRKKHISMDKIFVTTSGLLVVGIIYWFFFGKKDENVEVSDALTIIVNGGYKPSTIKIKQNKPVTLTFIRRDPNSCLEELVFPDFKIKEYLPVGKPVTITLSPPHVGTFGFHCGMNMFHGKIEVT